MNHIFLTDDGSRLRAGWRLSIQIAILWFLLICSGVPLIIFLMVGGSISLDAQNLSAPLLLALQILQSMAFILAVYLACRFLDKRSFESLGLKFNKQAIVDIFAGIAITFLQMGFIYLLLFGFGWLSFESFAWQTDSLAKVTTQIILFAILFIFTGLSEEILSRGYHLQTIAGGMNLFWGVFLSSMIFGLLHFTNPDATWISVFGIFIAGLFFAFAYIRTKQLWLPIGLHIGWNFFEGVGFGFPVSGLDIYPLIRIQVTGPELWTGGAFGPEAGLIVLPSLIIGTALIYLYTKNRDANI